MNFVVLIHFEHLSVLSNFEHFGHLSILNIFLNSCSFCPFYNFIFSKFDVPVLLLSIIRYCKENEFTVVPLQKHGKVSYLTLKIEEDSLVQFRDVLFFTSPCSLDRYAQLNGQTTLKNHFFPKLFSEVDSSFIMNLPTFFYEIVFA